MSNRLSVVRWIVLSVGLLAVACPGRVEIVEGRVTLEGVDLPDGCTSVQLSVTIEQGSRRWSSAALVRAGDLDLGRVEGIDLTQDVTVSIEVTGVVGACGVFEVERRWSFAGKATDRGTNDAGERVFTLPFSAFERVE